MPFSLGFWAAAGAGGGSTDYELISTTVLTGNATSITFSSIPSIYRHLEVRFTAQGDQTRTLYMRVNGDTTTSYVNHNLFASSTSISAGSNTGRTDMLIQAIYPSMFEGNVFTSGITTILDYKETTKNKTVRHLVGFNGDSNRFVMQGSGMWINTGAITSLTFGPVSDNMVSGTRFSLYGIRG